jgi:polysaccharide chain length determinant protein (PEP-CTERM system associated)
MIENRELGINDYLAVLRRRRKVILIPILLAPLAGFLVSYAFSPKYTSQALVLVEVQSVPEGYVKPVVTEDLTQRIATMQQQVLSRNRLQPMVERLGLVKNGKSLDDVVGTIQANIDVEPVQPGVSSSSSSGSSSTKKKPGPNSSSNIVGFDVNFTADNPRDAQLICNELTSMFLEENLKAREQVAQNTTDFLSRQVEEAKHDLDGQDSKLASFKKQYLGQLPGDEDTNLKILMGLNSQLDSNTQTLNRAQQDKTYSESLLAQDVAMWKASQSADNPQSIEQQLTKLQTLLVELQARYTDDYPDVAKTKRDIAQLRKKLKEINSAAVQNGDATEKANANEPPEIRQLRVQIHQYTNIITQATREQKRLQDAINLYQGRVALSPAVEEQFKVLTRDYETARKSYDDLLAKKGQSEVQADMERHQQGEQMRLLNAAGAADSPSFPVRWMFAAGGLGMGLVAGLGLAFLLEFQDKSIRDEKDVLAALELPMLVAVPWVEADEDGGESGTLLGRFKRSHEQETIGA